MVVANIHTTTSIVTIPTTHGAKFPWRLCRVDCDYHMMDEIQIHTWINSCYDNEISLLLSSVLDNKLEMRIAMRLPTWVCDHERVNNGVLLMIINLMAFVCFQYASA